MSSSLPDGNTTLNVEEAARRLGFDLATVRKALERGLLKGTQAENGEWRVLMDAEALGNGPRETALAPQAPLPRTNDLPEQDRQLQLLQELRLRETQAQLRLREAEVAEKDRLIGELSRHLAELSKALLDLQGKPDRR